MESNVTFRTYGFWSFVWNSNPRGRESQKVHSKKTLFNFRTGDNTPKHLAWFAQLLSLATTVYLARTIQSNIFKLIDCRRTLIVSDYKNLLHFLNSLSFQQRFLKFYRLDSRINVSMGVFESLETYSTKQLSSMLLLFDSVVPKMPEKSSRQFRTLQLFFVRQ